MVGNNTHTATRTHNINIRHTGNRVSHVIHDDHDGDLDVSRFDNGNIYDGRPPRSVDDVPHSMCVHPSSTGWRSIHVCRRKAKHSGSALPSQMWWIILGIPPDAITTEVADPSSTARPDANGVCSNLRSRTCNQSLSLNEERRVVVVVVVVVERGE